MCNEKGLSPLPAPQSFPSLKVTTVTVTWALFSLGLGGRGVCFFKSQLSLVVNQEYVSQPFSLYSRL